MIKEKKGEQIRKLMVTFACSVTLFVIISVGIIQVTFFDQAYLLGQIEKTKYSELVLAEAAQNFRKENTEESEFSEVVATALSPSFVEEALRPFIQHTYEETNYELRDSNEVSEKIAQAVATIATKKQLTIDKEEKNKIETMIFIYMYHFQSALGDRYFTIFIENIVSARKIVVPLFYICLGLLAFWLVYLYRLINKTPFSFLRYGMFILGTTGSMFCVLAGLLYIQDVLHNIAFHSQATLQLMTHYVQDLLMYPAIIGGILLFCAVLFGGGSKLLQKRQNKKWLKTGSSTLKKA